jgi:hypothetical protein
MNPNIPMSKIVVNPAIKNPIISATSKIVKLIEPNIPQKQKQFYETPRIEGNA